MLRPVVPDVHTLGLAGIHDVLPASITGGIHHRQKTTRRGDHLRVGANAARRRGLELPWGLPSDEPTAETVCGLGNRKNAAFHEVLHTAGGVRRYPGSVQLVDVLRGRGVRVAIVSSSANAPEVLRAAGLSDRFDAVVDGTVARAQKLAGKPRPDTYLYGAKLLHAAPERTVVVEDALSGVEADAAGGFGLVIGVDRGAGAEALRQRGADLVVSDLAEVVPGAG